MLGSGLRFNNGKADLMHTKAGNTGSLDSRIVGKADEPSLVHARSSYR